MVTNAVFLQVGGFELFVQVAGEGDGLPPPGQRRAVQVGGGDAGASATAL